MPKGKPRHFKSQEAYDKYAAYIHMHNIPHHAGEPVYIHGKKHVPNVMKECSGKGYCKVHGVIHY